MTRPLPEGAREKLLEAVGTARDHLVVTWLADGGFRIGELCGLHRPTCTCATARRAGSAGRRTCTSATGTGTRTGPRPKTKHPWRVENGMVTGGLIKRASPAMLSYELA
jgi:integrase